MEEDKNTYSSAIQLPIFTNQCEPCILTSQNAQERTLEEASMGGQRDSSEATAMQVRQPELDFQYLTHKWKEGSKATKIVFWLPSVYSGSKAYTHADVGVDK